MFFPWRAATFCRNRTVRGRQSWQPDKTVTSPSTSRERLDGYEGSSGRSRTFVVTPGLLRTAPGLGLLRAAPRSDGTAAYPSAAGAPNTLFHSLNTSDLGFVSFISYQYPSGRSYCLLTPPTCCHPARALSEISLKIKLQSSLSP